MSVTTCSLLKDFMSPPDTTDIDPNITKSIFMNGQIIWNEAKILYKIVYKSKNQHRRSYHYHKMTQVTKSLKKLYQVDLFLSWHIPRRAQNPLSYRQIIGYLVMAPNLIAKCMHDCLQLFAACRSLYDMEAFMPLAGVTLAIAARIRHFLKEYQIEMSSKLNTILRFLPQDQEESLLTEFKLERESKFIPKKKRKTTTDDSSSIVNSSSFSLTNKDNEKGKTMMTMKGDKADEIDEIFDNII